MIGVDGQWVLSLSLDSQELKIPPTDLIEFSIIEEAGNLLPTWSLQFYSTDYTFTKRWNEGAALTVSWGRDRHSLKPVILQVVNPSMVPAGDGRLVYAATGVLDALAYVNTPHVRTLGPVDALTIIKTIVSNYFTWDSNNITKSQDTQAYIQPNTSDKKFVDHLSRHAYLKGSYFGTAITADGRFRAVDAKAVLTEDAKYSIGLRLDPNSNYGKELTMISAPQYSSNSPLSNMLIGYGVEKPMVDTTTGTRIVHKPKPNIVAAQATKLPRSVAVERRTSVPVRLSTSHDVNYHVAAANNYMGLMNLSNESVTVLLECGLETISVWDTVQYTALAPGNDGKAVDEIHSGKYVVGLVSRACTGIGQNRFLTRVRMFRESTNYIKGDLHA